VHVPEDMSVIGFDDIAEASISYPPLTTIRQPLFEMGRLAAEYICRVIDGIETERLQVTLTTELIVRKSTGPLRQRVAAAD
jgi:LacI family transcriptional regulator